jgi:hypothetical protein
MVFVLAFGIIFKGLLFNATVEFERNGIIVDITKV